MNKNKKRLSSLAIILAFVFIVGAAYAASTGLLTFTGNAALGAPQVLLEIVAVTEGEVTAGESSSGTITVSEDGQTATITASIVDSADTLMFEFKVNNPGTTDAEITEVTTNNAYEEILLITGTYLNMIDTTGVVLAGEETGSYSIIVGWSGAADTEGDYEFTIELPYTYYTEPAE